MRLFVDCDDTLVLWQAEKRTRSDGLYLFDEWQRNDELIEAIEGFLRQAEEEIFELNLVVWSYGGEEYARKWAELFFPNRMWEALDKDPMIPDDESICIDDDLTIRPPSAAMVLTPEDFIKVRKWVELARK